MDEITPEDSPAENVPEAIIPEVPEENEWEIVDETGESEPPDENLPDLNLIDESVAFINQTVESMVKTGALIIGNYVLTRFFNDNTELASSKNRYKNISFSMLCRRPDLSLTRRELGVMVQVAAQLKCMRTIGIEIDRLVYTNQKLLAQLPDDQAKFDLIQECINKNLPSRQLSARIRQIKQAALPYVNPNDKVVNTYKQTMNRLITGTAVPELLSTQEGLYRLERETVLQLREEALQWAAGLEAKRRECDALIAKLDYTLAHPNY
ncbi:MAG: hypothetical protein WA081_02615 [Desulfosalsimonadaceae bacterium]